MILFSSRRALVCVSAFGFRLTVCACCGALGAAARCAARCSLPCALGVAFFFFGGQESLNMQNDKGVKVDLYIPRKWCVH